MKDLKTNELENQEMTNTEDSKTNELENQEMTNLEKDDLEKVTGGYVFYAPWHEDYKYEVIDDKTLGVMGRYKTQEDAKRAARHLRQGDEIIKSKRKLERMRKQRDEIGRDNINYGLYD